jgi:hypothetical protein
MGSDQEDSMTEPLDTQEAEKAQAQRYVAELLKHSQIEDVTIEIDSVHVLIIKGRIYEEKEGRIVQLQALNEGRVDVAGVPYQIVSAVISKARYMAYDFCLAKADGTGEALKLLVDYVTVRRMVERKTAAFDQWQGVLHRRRAVDAEHSRLPRPDPDPGGSKPLP